MKEKRLRQMERDDHLIDLIVKLGRDIVEKPKGE